MRNLMLHSTLLHLAAQKSFVRKTLKNSKKCKYSKNILRKFSIFLHLCSFFHQKRSKLRYIVIENPRNWAYIYSMWENIKTAYFCRKNDPDTFWISIKLKKTLRFTLSFTSSFRGHGKRIWGEPRKKMVQIGSNGWNLHCVFGCWSSDFSIFWKPLWGKNCLV